MSDMSGSGVSRRTHRCEQCSKMFTSTHQLAQHNRVHSGETPYSCSYCDKKFKQQSHVIQHTRLHTGERPYTCNVGNCGRSFIQLSNLNTHQKTHNSMDKISKDLEKKFFCNHCGKGFKGQSSLLNHQNKKHADLLNPMELILHSKDARNMMKFTCQLCGKGYQSETNYKRHVENEHKIGVGGSNGGSSSSAHSHSSLSSALWPCGACNSVFGNEFALISHMEQLRSDPKHQFEAQIILAAAADKHKQQNNQPNLNNILAGNLNVLVTGNNVGNVGGGSGCAPTPDEANCIAASMIAHNLMSQMSQNMNMSDDPSLVGGPGPANRNRTNGNHEPGGEFNGGGNNHSDAANACKYYSKATGDNAIH